MVQLIKMINYTFDYFTKNLNEYVGVPAVPKDFTPLSLAALSSAKTLSQQSFSVPRLTSLEFLKSPHIVQLSDF